MGARYEGVPVAEHEETEASPAHGHGPSLQVEDMPKGARRRGSTYHAEEDDISLSTLESIDGGDLEGRLGQTQGEDVPEEGSLGRVGRQERDGMGRDALRHEKVGSGDQELGLKDVLEGMWKGRGLLPCDVNPLAGEGQKGGDGGWQGQAA